MDYLTGLGLVLTAASVSWGVYVFRRQMNAQLFLEYTRRYDDVMRMFPPGARAYRLASEGEPPAESGELSGAVLQYLNLCSEEFYLWRRGYLSGDIWKIWEAEVKRTLASPLFLREWPRVKVEFGSYREFENWVGKVQQDRPS